MQLSFDLFTLIWSALRQVKNQEECVRIVKVMIILLQMQIVFWSHTVRERMHEYVAILDNCNDNMFQCATTDGVVEISECSFCISRTESCGVRKVNTNSGDLWQPLWDEGKHYAKSNSPLMKWPNQVGKTESIFSSTHCIFRIIHFAFIHSFIRVL